MPKPSGHYAMRQGNRRGEWATACGRSVRETSLVSIQYADWIVCKECRAAAIKARDEMSVEPPTPPTAVATDDQGGFVEIAEQQFNDLWAFVKRTAKFDKDGECRTHGRDCDGGEDDCDCFDMPNDDAVDTLHNSIDDARDLVNRYNPEAK